MPKCAAQPQPAHFTPTSLAWRNIGKCDPLNGRTGRRLGASCIPLFLLLICSCSPTLHPAITASVNSVNQMTINGTGFTKTVSPSLCAHLAMISPQSYSIGDANCSAGTFTTDWTPNYVPGCQPSGTQSAVVSAIDLATSDPAFASTAIQWGSNCAIVGTCGKIGQKVCPSPSYACYVDGGVDPATGTCVVCGNEGQPVCSNSPACAPGLNQNLSGSATVCTATCGGYNQSPCITNGTQPGVLVYTCYNTTLAYGDCVCVPNTQSNACQVESSGNSGVCQTFAVSPSGCKP
jgi:hypothetical protein